MQGLLPNEQRYQDMERVREAGERAAKLTRQLLGFSRRQMLQLSEIDVNEVVRDVMKLLRHVIGEHIELEFVPHRRLRTLQADGGTLEQILMNLCVNARDAMPEGGKLTIRTENVNLDETFGGTHPEAKPGQYVKISVSDTGTGMDPDVLDHVFEPFFTTKEQGKGTGLGLSMAYGIVKQHEGLIYAYSQPEKGTRFEIYLPISQAEVRNAVAEEKKSGFAGGNETILIAEDDRVVRDFGARVLKEAGYAVITAKDGERALDLLKETANTVDLVLLDVIMPKMGGHAVYSQLKDIQPYARVLFCSGYNPDATETGFVAEQNLQMIQKPYDAETLLRRVRSVLDEA